VIGSQASISISISVYSHRPFSRGWSTFTVPYTPPRARTCPTLYSFQPDPDPDPDLRTKNERRTSVVIYELMIERRTKTTTHIHHTPCSLPLSFPPSPNNIFSLLLRLVAVWLSWGTWGGVLWDTFLKICFSFGEGAGVGVWE